MKIKLLLLLLLFVVAAPVSYAQGGVKEGPDAATLRDPDLERDSYHNLEVARNYFKAASGFRRTKANKNRSCTSVLKAPRNTR
jgi:hypothetical protein